MITNPAKFVFDAIDHVATIEDRDTVLKYIDTLILSVNELDDSETASRIVYNFMAVFDIKDGEFSQLTNFWEFHKKHGLYVLNLAREGIDQPYRKLYISEDILNT